MPIQILMPALSPTMEFGTLRKWHVSQGDMVEAGDVLVEIETDKATMEVEAVEEGRIVELLVEEGTENVLVNAPIALLLDENESTTDVEHDTVSSTLSTPVQPNKAHVEDGHIEETRTEKTLKSLAAKKDSTVKASPLARRLASTHGIDLKALVGTGPNERIIKRDIEQALATGTSGEVSALQTLPPTMGMPDTKQSPQPMVGVSDKEIFGSYEAESYELIPHSNMRKTVAERLTLAKSTVPHFYLSIDCHLDELLAARKRLNDVGGNEAKRLFKLSVNDFIVKALALALKDVPQANASWSQQGVLQHKRSDVCVAVAVDGGLFTPIVRHADLKTLSEISNEVKDLAQRARNHKLKPAEYIGGSSTISNLGMYGIKQFDAVINPPQATILSVGQGREQPVAVNGSLTIATVMSVTLSCDHRVVDGALGAELLNSFKGYIEDPVKMLV